MEKEGLDERLVSFASEKRIFKNKDALCDRFFPEELPHRAAQIDEIAKDLAPSLKGSKPHNLFIHGKSGIGKTIVVKYVTKKIEDTAAKLGVPVKIIYMNCGMNKLSDTEYRLLIGLTNELSIDIPKRGLSLNEIYTKMFEAMDAEKTVFILILDEIDTLIRRTGSEFLYTFSRISNELEKSTVSLVGITNDLSFINAVDARIRSSLGEVILLFPPYDATQLTDIIQQRSKIAFNDGVLSNGVISKCAAISAQEHGDARMALNLLCTAGEISEWGNDTKITEKHIDKAEERLNEEIYTSLVMAQPTQSKAIVSAIIQATRAGGEVESGEVYAIYEKTMTDAGYKVLTQFRVSHLITELQTLGMISADIDSKGRYGRTRKIRMMCSGKALEKVKKILGERGLYPNNSVPLAQTSPSP